MRTFAFGHSCTFLTLTNPLFNPKMLFSKNTYTERRARLRQLVGHGLIVLMGNNESPMNYP